ncbi:hypothetical protein IGB42_03986 [Andreprevotia sp. IGB-42]|uniref:YdgA family protein n=1 Tax=Andreprevotia sp. IGB-42 TaxID=2497473 RepID=UPI001357C01E|nr:YdgA family protein [Andreprevotia sp. IGB-42]KAF0811529.1 hypothetical protein IGB42_03986 [Andreprevotia sp. IGB-42]
MSKIIGASLAVIALGAAGFAGATWYAGHKVDGKFDTVAEQLKGYELIKVAKRDFQKGFWTSTETVTYRVGCEDVKTNGQSVFPSQELTLRNTIHHNPFDTRIDTEIVYSKDAQETLNKVFKGQPPLVIRTAIPLTGDITTEISSPAATVTEAGKGTLNWKGFSGSFRYDENLARVKSQIKLTGFDVSEPNGGTAHFDALTAESDQTRVLEGIYTGKQTISWAGFGASMVTPEGKPVDFSIGKSSMQGESSIKDGLVTMAASGSADDLIIHKKKVGALSMDYSANRIDAKALKAYNDLSWKEGILRCNFDQKGSEERIKTLLVEVLARDPSVKMNLKLKTTAGEGLYQVDLASKDVKQADLANPMGLLAKLTATVAVQVPNALVTQLITDFNPEEAEMSQAMFDAALEQGTARGFVQNDGKLIQAKLVMKGGEFEINGQKKTMAELMMQQ